MRLHSDTHAVELRRVRGAEVDHVELAVDRIHARMATRDLRATLSLSRLWQQQGKREAALQVLAPVYGWFTEGVDTADLQEAKALLEARGGHRSQLKGLPK